MVNWQVSATVAAPIIALFVGVWINRWFESRSVLLVHWGHVSSFDYQGEDGTSTTVNTHSLVIKNAGRRVATNVRLSHKYLPSFNIWPRIQHKVEDVPNSGQDIVIPALIPNEHLTISYLYFPRMTFADINGSVKCDEGFATHIPVLLQRQYPSWFNFTVGALVIVGASALAYSLFELGVFITAAISN